MAIKLNVSDNQTRIPLKVSTNQKTVQNVGAEQHDPFYVGAEAKVEQLEDGALITCKDKSGTTTARIYDGEDGQDGRDGADGQDGVDGFSPIIEIESITDGHRITITDAEQTQSFDVMDGEDGTDGADGQDGVSPVANVSKVGDTATITITDANETTTATITDGADGTDGQDGTDGEDGVSPTITSEAITGGHRLTITDAEGTTTVDVMDGVDGQDGADGQDGYSPSASVTKVGSTATITITDKDGATTASISDGSAFAAEFGTTTYADVKDAYDNDAILICTVPDSGNSMVLQLVYFDVANEIFFFAFPMDDGWYWTQLSNADGWDDGQFYFASTDVATQLADGLMSALDKQKLDGLSKRNIWYGTSSTSASSSPKSITTASGDFSLTAGNMLVVLFNHTNSLSSVSLQVDGGVSKSAYAMDGTSDISNRWGSNEVVSFVYDGTKFVMLEQGLASTTQYGITKLNNTVTSTSTSEAATANAVKSAYDLADSKDANVQSDWNEADNTADDYIKNKPTIPVIPTNVSAFYNDVGYLTAHQDISGKADKIDTDIDASVITLFENLGWEQPT